MPSHVPYNCCLCHWFSQDYRRWWIILPAWHPPLSHSYGQRGLLKSLFTLPPMVTAPLLLWTNVSRRLYTSNSSVKAFLCCLNLLSKFFACTGFQTALFLTRVSKLPLRPGRHSVGGYRGVMPSLSSRYHLKSNNQAKRANQSLESALQGVLTRHPASWTFVPACWCWPPPDVPIIVQLYILRPQNHMKIFNSSVAAAGGVPVLNQYHSRECKIYT